MGYLNKSTITVDAILTKKGRELLAKGRDGFRITKFAVSDDEIDYTLYNTAHPLGTNYYGATIESMPILEAVPDETQSLKYKLVTLDRNTKTVSIISVGVPSVEMTYGVTGTTTITPRTSNGLDGISDGYTAILYDSSAAILTGTGIATAAVPQTNVSNTAVVAVGTSFTLTARDVRAQVVTQLTITGNASGATITIPVIVDPRPVQTVG